MTCIGNSYPHPAIAQLQRRVYTNTGMTGAFENGSTFPINHPNPEGCIPGDRDKSGIP
ncbi:hypothetical protein [Bradyrhizobium sp. SZCCHNR2020]|uniref:hypothetical protein n=1 Tax=Bradyrhizobium sp. SZCCHNR2020 TaxID=3057379 RepID=UPI002915D6D3|nr:hypothetical protein [Bradyrhizobium sp. SZCCHNR2020]